MHIKSNISGSLRRTLEEEMRKDETIFIFGEDIEDPYGGIHNVTKGLSGKFENRVINSPLSESVIAGTGVGAALNGMKPIVEIMYADFLPIVMEQIVNNAAKMHFLSKGDIDVPLTIRVNYGSGKGEGAQHSQSPEAWFMNFPGLKIVSPSTPRDAQGLLKSSIEDKNPVLFLEHKMLYKLKGKILKNNEPIPLGKADIKKSGDDLTIVSNSLMLQKTLKCVEELEKNYSIEIIDIRSLKPIDKETICDSVIKTGKLLVIEEGHYTGGWGAQIVDYVVNEAFEYLDSSPRRLTAPDVPIPAKKEFEDLIIPGKEEIKKYITEMLENS